MSHMKPKSISRSYLLLLLSLFAACASTPPATQPAAKGAAPASLPREIATPVSESGPASIEARLAPKQDSEMLLHFTVQSDGKVQGAGLASGSLGADTDAAVLAAFSALHFLPYQK